MARRSAGIYANSICLCSEISGASGLYQKILVHSSPIVQNVKEVFLATLSLKDFNKTVKIRNDGKWVEMKAGLILVVFFSLLIIFVQFTHTPSDENDVSYRRYREEFAQNLRNPLTEHYRGLSFETQSERGHQEIEMEEAP